MHDRAAGKVECPAGPRFLPPEASGPPSHTQWHSGQ